MNIINKEKVCPFLGNSLVVRDNQLNGMNYIEQSIIFHNCIKDKCIFFDNVCLLINFLKKGGDTDGKQ